MISKLMLIELKTLKQLVKNKSNIDVNKVKGILQLDPTLKVNNINDDTEIGTYGEWLLKTVYDEYDKLNNNDKEKIKEDLKLYTYLLKSKQIPEDYDNIYKIKTIKTFHEIITNIKGDSPVTQDPVTLAIGNHKFKTVNGNPCELLRQLFNDTIKENGVIKWLVFNPKNMNQSKVAGLGASWCTSQDNSKNLWYTYIYEGNTAWIFLLSGKYKDANPDEYTKLVNLKLDKICIIVERGQCQTRDNRLFKLELLPEIGDFVENKIDDGTIKLANHNILSLSYRNGINYILTGIKNKDNRLALMFKMTKEKLIELFKNRPNDYETIIDELLEDNVKIDKDIQMLLIKANGDLIRLILKAGIKPKYDVQLLLVSQNGYLIKYIIQAGIRPEYDVQLLLVSRWGNLIEYIKNPSKDIQLLLVSKNGLLIQYIINPSEEVQLLLIKQNPDLYEHIINPSENVQLLLIKQNPDYIQYIINPSEEVQLLLVSQNGLLIQYINNPSKDIQMLLVSQNGRLIKYIIQAGVQPKNDKEWQDVQMLLVSKTGELILYIKNPSEKVQLLLVSQTGYLIKYIIDAGIKPEHDVQLLLVTRKGWLIYYIIETGIKPEHDVQLLLVSQDGYLIELIKNPSEEVQLLLIENTLDLYNYIYNPTPKLTLLYKQLNGIKESTQYISKLLDVN